MVNIMTCDQKNLVDTITYPQISVREFPPDLALRLPLVAANSTTYGHPPLFTVDDGQDFRESLPGMGTKNLFLKDKKGVLWLITAQDETKVDLNAFSQWLRERHLASSRLSFGSPDLLLQTLGVTPGSVTPLALVNDAQRKVNIAFDARLMGAELISCHPLRNDMTTVMTPQILYKTLTDLGYRPLVIDFSQDPPRSVEAAML